MSLQFSVSARNSRLDALEAELGTNPVCKFRTGAPPANCAASDTGSVVATLALPSDHMLPAADGSKSKSGTWEDTAADNSGTIGHFRLYKSDGVTAVIQGTVTAAAGNGDMKIDNPVVVAGQQITVVSFTINDGNA